MSVIPATREAEARGMRAYGQPGKLRDLSIKQKKVKDWEYSSVAKCLPIVCKVIGPIPSTIEIAILKISVMVSIAYIYITAAGIN